MDGTLFFHAEKGYVDWRGKNLRLSLIGAEVARVFFACICRGHSFWRLQDSHPTCELRLSVIAGTYIICPEAYASYVSDAQYTIIVRLRGAVLAQYTGKRNKQDSNTACSASFDGAITLNIP